MGDRPPDHVADRQESLDEVGLPAFEIAIEAQEGQAAEQVGLAQDNDLRSGGGEPVGDVRGRALVEAVDALAVVPPGEPFRKGSQDPLGSGQGEVIDEESDGEWVVDDQCSQIDLSKCIIWGRC